MHRQGDTMRNLHPPWVFVKCFPQLSIVPLVASIALLLNASVRPALAQSVPNPTPGTQQLHGHLSPAIKQAPLVAHLDASTSLTLSIGLPLRNQEQLSTALSAIYDQHSAQYRHYFTPDQFAAAYGPSEQDYQAVVAFARSRGLTVNHTFSNRVLVAVSGTSGNVERAFHVSLNTYKRPDGSIFRAPDREPSLDLSTPVLHIGGLENYILPHSPLRPVEHLHPMPNAGTAPNGFFGGADFRNAYAPGTGLNGAGQCVGLLEYAGFYANDISLYENQFHLPNVPITTVLLNNFDGSPGTNNSEVPLDIEMAIAMAPGLKSVVVFEDATTDSYPDTMLSEMAAPTRNEPLCKQLSSSWTYGVDVLGQELFGEMAMQGQSFFNGSGDSGAYASDPGDNRDAPYITIVGGTVLSMNGNGASWQSETTWSSSGGGILTSVNIPGYQSAVSMSSNYGSTQFRNVPDVSMIAYGAFIYENNGATGYQQGTSISAPLWAGFMALVNQRAAMCGSSSVGFANPALYAIGQNASKYAADFHDIQSGNSGTAQKYPAVAGYDLATGWGSLQANLINDLSPPTPACMPAPPTNFSATPQ
jgi:subtilase family serine protease